MTNEQKYRTAEERIKAFSKFCRISRCAQCVLNGKADNILDCTIHWLALEAEEEKLEPCPFCGSATYLIEDDNQYLARCRNRCCYRGKSFLGKSDAIAAHNRVARAVMAEKESEARK